MPPRAPAIDKAIRDTLAALEGIGLPRETAVASAGDLVEAAMARTLDGASTPRRTSGKSAPQKRKKGGAARGPKPGGRQLKAHIGAKAFDALPEPTKDLARQAISKRGDKWGTMSGPEKDKFLAPLIKDVSAK
jgi:hypothetical protein